MKLSIVDIRSDKKQIYSRLVNNLKKKVLTKDFLP